MEFCTQKTHTGKFQTVRALVFLLITSVLWNGATALSKAPRNTWIENPDFPRLFLPQSERQRQPHEVSATVVDQSLNNLEAAMKSVLSRLTLPVFIEGRVQTVNYFDYLHRTHPDIPVFASGGVARTTIGYIYSELLLGYRANPRIEAEETFRRIINSKDPIRSFEVRGVGSDWDLLIDVPEKDFKRHRDSLASSTNDLISHSGVNMRADGANRQVLAVPDIKDYGEQTKRSMNQGGSDIDYLAFNVASGHFVQPSNMNDIVANLIRGTYRHHPPVDEKHQEYLHDQDSTTHRGPRAMLEIPFLQLESDAHLLKELQRIEKRLSREPQWVPKEKAIRQFDRMVRNSRFSGANNRFYRRPKNAIETLFKDIALELGRRTKRVLLPEFLDEFPIHGPTGRRSQLNGIPENLLMPMGQFISNHTKDGILFHGTPRMENGLAILRQGLFISSSHQGVAVYDRGTYTSPDRTVAQSYAGSEGIIFDLRVRSDLPLNILNWDDPEVKKWAASPTGLALKQEAADREMDLFELLAREHGIDVIIHNHVLLQNLNAVHIDRSLRALLTSVASRMTLPERAPWDRFEDYLTYRGLHQVAHEMGETDIPSPITEDFIRNIVQEFIKPHAPESPKNEKRSRTLRALEFVEELLSSSGGNLLTAEQRIEVVHALRDQGLAVYLDDHNLEIPFTADTEFQKKFREALKDISKASTDFKYEELIQPIKQLELRATLERVKFRRSYQSKIEQFEPRMRALQSIWLNHYYGLKQLPDTPEAAEFVAAVRELRTDVTNEATEIFLGSHEGRHLLWLQLRHLNYLSEGSFLNWVPTDAVEKENIANAIGTLRSELLKQLLKESKSDPAMRVLSSFRETMQTGLHAFLPDDTAQQLGLATDHIRRLLITEALRTTTLEARVKGFEKWLRFVDEEKINLMLPEETLALAGFLKHVFAPHSPASIFRKIMGFFRRTGRFAPLHQSHESFIRRLIIHLNAAEHINQPTELMEALRGITKTYKRTIFAEPARLLLEQLSKPRLPEASVSNSADCIAQSLTSIKSNTRKP